MAGKNELENLNQQMALMNCVVGLLVLHKHIDPEELAKLSPFGYTETMTKLKQMTDFVDALLKNYENLKEKKS